MPGPQENPQINSQNVKNFNDRINNAKKALAQSQQLADKARLTIELEGILREVQEMNGVIGKADKLGQKLNKGKNGFFGKESRENKVDKLVDRSLDAQRDIDTRLSSLEDRLGIRNRVDIVVSPEVMDLASNYSEPYEKNGQMYVKDKVTGVAMLLDDVIKKENSLAGAQQVIPGGGVLGNINSGLQNQVGYKQGNANNITQMAKYAAVAGLVYLRWTKTRGFAEKAGYAALAYALVSPCGFDLWNIIMNGKSNAVNGKGLFATANSQNNGSNNPNQILENNKAIEDYNKTIELFDKNKGIGIPSYSIFKDQATADMYIDKQTGNMKYKQLYEDYINNNNDLRKNLNTNLNGFDPKLSTTENFMGVLKGLLYDKNQQTKSLEGEDLRKAEEDLNKQRSEYLKSIGADQDGSLLDIIKKKLIVKQREIQDLKEKATTGAIKNRGYMIVPGKEKGAFIRIDQIGANNPKLIDTLLAEGFIMIDKKTIDREMNILEGAKKITNLEQVKFSNSEGVEAISLAKKFVEQETGEEFDIYNDKGKLYIQTGTMRTELVIINGKVIRLGEPFNVNIKGDIVKMMHIGLAVCHLKEYMGLLASTKGKDKIGKDIIISDFFDLSMTATSLSGIILNKKGIDAGRFGSFSNDNVSKATKLLKGYTEEVQDRFIVQGMNQLFSDVKDVWKAGNETPAEHLASGIRYTPGSLPIINNAENLGGDIKISLETESSIKEMIKNGIDGAGEITQETLKAIYEGGKKGVVKVSDDLRYFIANKDGQLQKWYDEVLKPGSKKLVEIIRDGTKFLLTATLDVIRDASSQIYEALKGAIGGPMGDLRNWIHSNPAVSTLLYAAIGGYIGGGVGAYAIVGGLCGLIISLYKNSKPVAPDSTLGAPAK